MLEDGANMGDLLEDDISLLEKYNDCAARHDALATFVSH
jgi:hypothetical protein